MIDNENTTNLMDELSSTRNLSHYLDKYSIDDSRYLHFTDYLETLFATKHLKKAMIIRELGMTRSFAYDIFSGRKRPSRDNTLLLSYGLELDYKETQRLLLAAKHNPLHPKDKRDSILIYAKINHYSLLDTNILLDDYCLPIID